MKRTIQIALCLLLLNTLPLHAAEVIDRIVATVNRSVILQSDLDVAVRYQALLEGRALASITSKDFEAALERLVDQQLLVEEMGTRNTFAVSDREVQSRIDEIRKQFPEAASEQGWRELLQRYWLDESDVAGSLKLQLEILQFIDRRLRPNARVERSAVEEYYRDELLPKLREAGKGEVPLAEVSARIRQILTERHIDELLGVWLHNLRDQSEIHREVADHAPDAGRQHASVSRSGADAARTDTP